MSTIQFKPTWWNIVNKLSHSSDEFSLLMCILMLIRCCQQFSTISPRTPSVRIRIQNSGNINLSHNKWTTSSDRTLNHTKGCITQLQNIKGGEHTWCDSRQLSPLGMEADIIKVVWGVLGLTVGMVNRNRCDTCSSATSMTFPHFGNILWMFKELSL